MKKYSFTEQKDTRSGFGVGLLEVGRNNPNVVGLTADLTGSLKMDAFEKEFPNRFFQVEVKFHLLVLLPTLAPVEFMIKFVSLLHIATRM